MAQKLSELMDFNKISGILIYWLMLVIGTVIWWSLKQGYLF
jgi:hypothetical protein